MLFNLNKKIQSQNGAALLAFVLVMLVGSSFLFISKLNAKVRNREDIEKTYDALQRAKEAVIAFALTTPERSNAVANPIAAGPGYLPCPDTDNNGSVNAGGACTGNNLGPNVRIGRIPFATLESDALTGSSGEVLWYAIDLNYGFSGFGGPINSETVGQLSFDGINDIVAVIFDPGISLNNQDREDIVTFDSDGDGIQDSRDPDSYLENDNSDLNDAFISNLIGGNPTIFNDKAIAITRQELMSVVEKRVLGEVRNTLNQMRLLPGVGNEGFPWLRPFNTAPNLINDFRGNPGTNQGYLSLFMPQAFYNARGFPYPLNIASGTFGITWSGLTGGAYVPTNGITGNAPTEQCLRNSNCTETYYCNSQVEPLCGTVVVSDFVYEPINITPPTANLTESCDWNDSPGVNAGRNTFLCTLVIQSSDICVNDGTSTCFGTFERTYTFNFTDDGTNINYSAPTNASHLLRDVFINGAFPNPVTITVSDVGDGTDLGSATLSATSGQINVVGLEHHIDTVGVNLNPGMDNDYSDPGELPPEIPKWFVDNDWHQLVQIVYPQNEALPGRALGACTPTPPPSAVPCITLNNNGIANGVDNNIRALAIIAGNLLPGQTANRRNVSFNPNDYFDNPLNQALLNDIFNNQLPSNVYNDQLMIINP